MAWGAARSGIDDLLQRLQQPKTGKNLCVLSFRKLTIEDVQKLARAITDNTILEELYLSGHKLGLEGVKAFADCLAVNSTLKHLSIGEDALGDAGVAVLCDGLARNATSGVQVWDLEHKSIGPEGAAALGKLLSTTTTLKSLNVSRNAIGNTGMEALANGLASNAQSTLHTLTLTETGVSGAALDLLALALEQPHCPLETLQLSFNALSDAGVSFFAALAKNTSIKKLYLKECKLNDAHAAALADALKTNTCLEEVDLSDNELTAAACAALAMALACNTTLTSLTLGNNKCADTGAVALGAALASDNTTLKYLDLSKNALTHTSITLLLTARSVTELRLFNNALGSGLTEVLPVLLANTTLETLDLGANALHGALSVALFDALHAHSSLKTLEMGGNSLGQEGHDALAKLREINTTLDVAVDKNAQDEHGNFDESAQ